MACACGQRRSAPVGWPPLLTYNPQRTPGGAATCSAFPEAERERVADAWEPVARVYQVYAGFQLAMLPSLLAITGPLAIAVAPFLALGVLLSALPYVVVELAINCNPSEQVARQAKRAREALDLVEKVPDVAPIPGLSELKRACRLVRPFLIAGEQGKRPSAAAFADVAKAGGILDGLPPDVVATLETLVAPVLQTLGVKPPNPLPWDVVAVNQYATPGADAKTLAIARAKAAAKIRAQERNRQIREAAKRAAIEAAKAKAKAKAAEKGAKTPQEVAAVVVEEEQQKKDSGIPLALAVPVLGIVANALGLFGKVKR